MMNPFGPQSQYEPDLSSYVNLKQRMLKKVQAAKLEDQIFQIVQNAFEDALGKENVVLSRPERKRLFSQILLAVLNDMAGKLDARTRKDDSA
jgi:hypothetical protein